jgi:hypothetical protein
MPSSQVPLWVPIVVALVGFAGVLTAQVIANRRADKQWDREREQEDQRWERERKREDQRWAREKERRAQARGDKKRHELADAIAQYASSVTSLRRAEFDRAMERIGGAPDIERRATKQDTQRLRGEAESKMYLVSLFSDPQEDQDLVRDADSVINRCHDITKESADVQGVLERNRLAKEALSGFIEKARRCVQEP